MIASTMFESFHTLPWYITGGVIITFYVLLSVSILFIIRRYFSNAELIRDSHEVSGIVFNIIGVLYAVLLGFTVLNVQDRFQTAHRTAEGEANAVIDLFRNAQVFSDSSREHIRTALREYVQSVISSEWPAMARAEASPETSEALQNLWLAYYKVDLSNDKAKAWYNISLTKLNDLNDYRYLRLFSSQESLDAMMWTLLITGGIVIIFFVYLSWIHDWRLHMILAALLAGNVAFMLFLTFSLDTPFEGDESIKPTAMERVLTSFDTWDVSFENK